MLLAAGRSTRLGALGERLPKPLAPVCGYPPLQFGLAALVRAGLPEVVVNLHHHGEMIRDALGDGSAFGARVAYSPETDLLGTGGGLALARPLFRDGDGGGAVLVMNGKVVADVDLGAVVAAHQASGAAATLVLRDDPDARTWGPIAADETGRIVSILGVTGPVPPVGVVVERMFTGIQIVGPPILDRLRPVFCDTVRDGYIPALLEGADLRAFVFNGYFAEHSTPERYLAGNLALLRDPALVRFPPGPLRGVDEAAWVDFTARLVGPVRIATGALIGAGAVVGPDVVVGAGATIGAGVHVSRAVLWPGVIVERDAASVVITPDGAVAIADDGAV
ncbi:MAG TPA: NDP-sugar synthase [Polyangia bacterium]